MTYYIIIDNNIIIISENIYNGLLLYISFIAHIHFIIINLHYLQKLSHMHRRTKTPFCVPSNNHIIPHNSKSNPQPQHSNNSNSINYEPFFSFQINDNLLF